MKSPTLGYYRHIFTPKKWALTELDSLVLVYLSYAKKL